MNRFITVLAALCLTSPVNAFENDVTRHRELYNAINETTDVVMNPVICFTEKKFHGFYSRVDGTIVICQDKRTKPGVMVVWTANDLDTLRHEAHHLIQDCTVGEIGDFESGLYLDNINTSVNALGNERTSRIAESYSTADNHTIRMEIEAFAVADNVQPETIANAIRKHCK